MLEKIRPNVIVLSLIGGALTWYVVGQLVGFLKDIEGLEAGLAIVAVLSTLIGIGIGSLFTIASQVAQDPPPPTVPAPIAERLINVLEEELKD